MGRSVTVAFTVCVALITGCADGGSETSVSPAATSTILTSTAPETPATVPSTDSGTTTTTAPPPAPATTVTVPPPGAPVVLEPEDLGGRRLVWERTDVELDRWPPDLAFFAAAGSLWIAQWDRSTGLEVRSSFDGYVWGAPVEAIGVPAGIEPAMLQFAPWVTGGPAGAVLLGENSEFGAPRHVVATTVDGIQWTAHPSLNGDSEVRAIAAGSGGFLVVGDTNTAWVSPDGGEWDEITFPAGAQYDVGAVAAGDNFVIAGDEAVLVVDADGHIVPVPSPGPAPLFTHLNPWADGVVTVARGVFRPGPWRIALLETTDLAGWNELPVPVLAGPQDWRSGDIWGIETVTAGLAGITVAAYIPDGVFDFWGNGFWGIEFPLGDGTGGVFGDSVMIHGPSGAGIESSFDEQGALTIRDRATAETIATVTCPQLRALAIEQAPQRRTLVEWPQQIVLWSPDGRAWEEGAVPELFGPGSYVTDLAVIGGHVVAMVVPSGEPPTPDPPNCALGLYPDAGPIEVWVGTPGS